MFRHVNTYVLRKHFPHPDRMTGPQSSINKVCTCMIVGQEMKKSALNKCTRIVTQGINQSL